MNTKIESLGIYLPDTIMTTKELLKRCSVTPKWDFERITGVTELRISENENSFEIALKAVNKALKMSKYSPEDIGMIIYTGLSKFTDNGEISYEPSMSLKIRKAINAKKAQTFDLINACAGMFTGIMIMDSFIKTGVIKCGIVISAEEGSKLHESALKNIKHGLDGQFASFTLGDCGACVILDASIDNKYGFHRIDFITGAKYSNLCVGYPAKDGSGTTMNTKPRKLHKIASNVVNTYIKETLDNTGWHFNDVDFLIPHQTAVRSMKLLNRIIYEFMKVEKRDNVLFVVNKYGNTATTSHSLVLHEYMMNNTIKPGNNLMFQVGASGMIVGMITYTIDDLPIKYKNEFGEKNE